MQKFITYKSIYKSLISIIEKKEQSNKICILKQFLENSDIDDSKLLKNIPELNQTNDLIIKYYNLFTGKQLLSDESNPSLKNIFGESDLYCFYIIICLSIEFMNDKTNNMERSLITYNIFNAIVVANIAKELNIKKSIFSYIINAYLNNFAKLMLYNIEKGVFLILLCQSLRNNLEFNIIEKKIYKRSIQSDMLHYILEKFKFNKNIILFQKYYFMEESEIPKEQILPIMIVKISNLITSSFNIGYSGKTHLPKIEKKYFDKLKITEEKLKNIYKNFVPSILFIKQLVDELYDLKKIIHSK